MKRCLFKAGIGLLSVISLATASYGATESDAPYASTYEAGPSDNVLIRGANVYDGIGHEFDSTDVLLQDGRIKAIGKDLSLPDGAHEIDGTGKWVTPGIIDVHSHLGDYPTPSVKAHSDGNEATKPVTAEVWAEHSIWPQDPGFNRARTGGTTTLMVLPGSANLFGGRGVVLKNVPARTVQGMKFPGAHYSLKMACGENPKRVYGKKGGPSTRMGNFAGYRTAWIKARAYKAKWAEYEKNRATAEKDGKEVPKPPERSLQMETLVGALNGDIYVNMHCYRADEMAQVMDMAKEFGYQVRAFHHAVEAYKIPDLLKQNHVCAAMWADWGGFKMEAYDSIRENIAMVDAAGACALIHSDSEVGIQRLNQEVAKAMADGRKAGLEITNAQAWKWLSANPAYVLGIQDETGSLEVGKAADVLLWNAEPFSIRARPQKVWIDGALMYDRNDKAHQAVSDFEIGQPGEGDTK